MKKSRLLGAMMSTIITLPVHAALVGVNDSNYAFLGTSEDGFNITLDTSTDLEWLDWSLTLDRSYDSVFALTQGGSLDGWRYATPAEIESLTVAAGLPTSFLSAAPGGTHSAFELLNTFLGSGSNDNESIAIADSRARPTVHRLTGFIDTQLRFELPETGIPSSLFSGLDDGASNIRVGSALVRDVSVVPVPAAVWLFGSGLIGLVGLARRKKA